MSTNSFFTLLLWCVVLFLMQVLVFNHVHLLGYATPMPYIYALLVRPSRRPRWETVALGFVMGLTIDVFSGMPGPAAASLTLLGLLCPPLLNHFAPDERRDEAFTPSVRAMGWPRFLRYATTALLLHTTAFFLLENFNFLHPLTLLLNITGSTLLSLLFIAAMERVRK